MPRKTRRKRHVKRMRGDGFFGDVWNGIKSVAVPVYNHVLKPAWNAKLISKGLSYIPHPYAQGASQVARALGGGRQRGGAGFADQPNYVVKSLKNMRGKGRKPVRLVGYGVPHLSGRLYLN